MTIQVVLLRRIGTMFLPSYYRTNRIDRLYGRTDERIYGISGYPHNGTTGFRSTYPLYVSFSGKRDYGITEDP